ncbi:hypothetical protein BJV74DRAFT_881489 [Russula compacta]|nr:hypothetical protein BJV74DRAFT_881489 [Russula compacta]
MSVLSTSLDRSPPTATYERSSAQSTLSSPDHDEIVLEGFMDNIVGVSDVSVDGGSAGSQSAFSRWLPALREIKQRIQQLAEGRLQRSSHLDQSEPSDDLSLRRCTIRLLMTCASLSPADFECPVGYLGPSESTPFYPTGDLGRDRDLAYNIAMDSLDDLDVYLQGSDDVRIANKLFELAQALSDLGLREYALNVSGSALDAFERSFVAAPNNFRLHVALVLSLRANILCDLMRNEESRDAVERAVTLCKEHQDSQTGPVPELAYTSLNYAVLLGSIGLKDESAAVAFELLGEADESQPI